MWDLETLDMDFKSLFVLKDFSALATSRSLSSTQDLINTLLSVKLLHILPHILDLTFSVPDYFLSLSSKRFTMVPVRTVERGICGCDYHPGKKKREGKLPSRAQ